MSLTNKVTLVTGASRGIGRAVATTLGKAGATILGTATTPEGADKISAYLKEEGITGAGYALDVRHLEAIKDTLIQIQNDFSAPEILVNNAGVHRDNLLLRMKEEQWDEVMNTNLTAIYRLSKLCVRPMLKKKWGRIINITSVVGVMGNPGQTNYCASKAGLIGFSKALALEVASHGITVNAVAPGFIETDMTLKLTPEQREQINLKIPMKTPGLPQDIAAAVCFLASDANYMTGQTLHINGGMCMV